MIDSLLFWNDVAVEATRVSRTGGEAAQADAELGAQALAIVHLAMYDAYVAVAKPADFAPNLPGLPSAPVGASASAAVAGAAHEALSVLFSGQREVFDRRLGEAAIAGDDPGQPFGRAVASAHLADRSGRPRDRDAEVTPSTALDRHGVDPGVESSVSAQGFLGPFWSARVKGFSIIARRVLVTRPFNNHKAFRVLRAVRKQGFGVELAGSRQLPGAA
jgi:hypothetical protein